MQLINYIRISNFKGFGENITIDFSQPSVLIGPNNSGKTTVLQALAMWSVGIKTWFREKGQGKVKVKWGKVLTASILHKYLLKKQNIFGKMQMFVLEQ